MGIEPTLSAWKAEVLPLNYTRSFLFSHCPCNSNIWWRGQDSNLRRLSRQIYSLIPLTAREPLRAKLFLFETAKISRLFCESQANMSTKSSLNAIISPGYSVPLGSLPEWKRLRCNLVRLVKLAPTPIAALA